MKETGLVKYDAMCTAIAECLTADEAKQIRNKAKALEVYAKQAKNYTAERKAAEVRIRAERRAGELVRTEQRSGRLDSGDGGDRKSRSRNTTVKAKLADVGISKDQSSKWQKLADIPAQDFEKALAAPGPVPTTDGLINAHIAKTVPQPKIDPLSLWAWGQVRDFERRGVLQLDPDVVRAGMTDNMREDMTRLVPAVVAFLERLA